MVERRLPERGGEVVGVVGSRTTGPVRQRARHLGAELLDAHHVATLEHRAVVHRPVELQRLRDVVGAQPRLREVRVAEGSQCGFVARDAPQRGEKRLDVHVAGEEHVFLALEVAEERAERHVGLAAEVVDAGLLVSLRREQACRGLVQRRSGRELLLLAPSAGFGGGVDVTEREHRQPPP